MQDVLVWSLGALSLTLSGLFGGLLLLVRSYMIPIKDGMIRVEKMVDKINGRVDDNRERIADMSARVKHNEADIQVLFKSTYKIRDRMREE